MWVAAAAGGHKGGKKAGAMLAPLNLRGLALFRGQFATEMLPKV